MAENKQSEERPTQDPWVWYWVIIFLGVAMLVSLLGAIVLVGWNSSPVPQVVVAIGSAAVGALAGILVPTPTAKTAPKPEAKPKELAAEAKAGEIAPKAGGKPTIKIPSEIETWVYRAIVVFLGIATLFALLGAIVLAAIGKNNIIPSGIVAIGSAAVGALAGVLSPSPLGSEQRSNLIE
ncbi:MAG TPA: hypothetical protein VEG28_02820 [Dehalococcoidia bacterium]|nr:hypothetical protein [Dehalococcoidia bacterium]